MNGAAKRIQRRKSGFRASAPADVLYASRIGQGLVSTLHHAAISIPATSRATILRTQEGPSAGGFGIAMMRSLVDEFIYNEARNEVICIKYLD